MTELRAAIGPIDDDTVFVVMILYKSEDSIPSFMQCLQRQTTRNWRLMVIDNNSPDNSFAVLSRYGDERVTVLRNSINLGFAKAANQGLVASADRGGLFYVLMNNDVHFAPDFLQLLVTARTALQAEVITPRIMHMEAPDEAWYAGGSFDDGWLFRNTHGAHDPAADQTPRRVDFATGCCLGLTRSVLSRAGLLDESYFVYWEDVDFCLRLKKRGIPIVYVPALSLLHAGAAASGGVETPSHIGLYYRSYMQFLRRNFGIRRAVRSMIRLLLQENERQARDPARLRGMAMAMLRGLAAPLRKIPELPARLSART